MLCLFDVVQSYSRQFSTDPDIRYKDITDIQMIIIYADATHLQILTYTKIIHTLTDTSTHIKKGKYKQIIHKHKQIFTHTQILHTHKFYKHTHTHCKLSQVGPNHGSSRQNEYSKLPAKVNIQLLYE